MWRYSKHGDWYYARLMGLPFRSKLEQQVWTQSRREDQLLLEPEPQNTHDPNAVKVILEKAGQRFHVGYLPTELAKEISPQLASERFIALVLDPSSVKPALRIKSHPAQEAFQKGHPWEDLEREDRRQQASNQGELPYDRNTGT